MARRSLILVALIACGGDPGTTAPSVSNVPVPVPEPPSGTATPIPTPSAPATTSSNDYGTTGPHAVQTSETQVDTGTHTITLHVWSPDSPGAHPVVSLSPGLLQDAVAYAPFARRLASWGIATLVRDDPGAATMTPDVVSDIAFVVSTWIPSQPSFDATRIGLAGHSRGGKASLLAAEALGPKVRAWFGLDPVDAAFLAGGKQARDGLASLSIPTAYLLAQVASSCSPAAYGSDVLFPLTPSPSVEITGVGAGHTQLQDPSACTACAACYPAGTADGPTVLTYAVRYLTAFFARELLGSTNVGAAFEGAGAPSDVAAGNVTIRSK